MEPRLRFVMGKFFSQNFNKQSVNIFQTRMWTNAQSDGRPAEHSWCPLFNAAKFG